MQYLYNRLIDFDDIWYDDARWLSQTNRLLMAAILKIEKSQYL